MYDKTKKRKSHPSFRLYYYRSSTYFKEKKHRAQTGEIISTALDPMFPENPFIR